LLCAPLVDAITYYVDTTGGSDSNNGTSEVTAWKTVSKVNGVSFSPGDEILFKRGETWREQLIPHSGDETGYITYGAYGTGNKPLLLGSVTRNDTGDWAYEGGNIWVASGLLYDVGNLIFNDEESVGEKVRNESELDAQGKFWYDENNFILKLYSVANPATVYSNIECTLNRYIVSLSGQSYAIFENLDVRYGGAHGIAGEYVHHIIVRDCDFSYIGGGRHTGELRYGNGIEFWNSAHDTTVERCTFSEIYDAALTTQGTGSGNEKYNQYFRNNIVWNSEYCFEFWNKPETSRSDNIYFENNTCLNAGYGWGHNQRWIETDAGWHNGRHLALSENTADTNNIYIMNNIIYEAKNDNMVVADTWNGFTNVVMDNNIWYQTSSVYGRMITCVHYSCSGVYAMNEFAQYQMVSGNDMNSLATDPLFLNEGSNDFHPVMGSPACNLSDEGYFAGALPCVDAANDIDRDGMSDSFENLYNLDPDNPEDVNNDNDLDGLSNLWEYLKGTDPGNADTDGDEMGDSADNCPVDYPVNIGALDYSSLQVAYNDAAEDAVVKSQDTIFTEDLAFDINKSIYFDNGYDCSYSAIQGTTTVRGDISLSSGLMIIQNGNLKIIQTG
jgi:hypothetical protein